MAPPGLAFAAVGVLLAAALAGCAGEGEGPPPTGIQGAATTRGDGTPVDPVARPEWAVGDAWTYEFGGQPTTYVVTSETATDWIVETDSAERSFSDLRDDISRLGPQRKSDLAGSQGGDRVEFFRWPLEAGKTWRTRWDQQDVTVRVIGVTPLFVELEAVDANGAQAYHYTYDPAARWFGQLTHYAPDGSELVALKLTDATRGWSGTVVRWTLTEVVADNGTDGATASGPFEVPEGATDVWAKYAFTCTGAAGYLVAVEPLNPGLGQQGKTDSGQCVHVDKEGTLVDGPHPGTWGFTLDVGGQTADFDYVILVRVREDARFPA